MPKQTMIATTLRSYGGRRLNAGDEFIASSADAKILALLKKATYKTRGAVAKADYATRHMTAGDYSTRDATRKVAAKPERQEPQTDPAKASALGHQLDTGNSFVPPVRDIKRREQKDA